MSFRAPRPVATPAMSKTLAELSLQNHTQPAPLDVCLALPLPPYTPSEVELVHPDDWDGALIHRGNPVLRQVINLPLVDLVVDILDAIERHVPKVNVGGHYPLGPENTLASAWRIRHTHKGAPAIGTDPLKFLPSPKAGEYHGRAMQFNTIFQNTILAGSDYALRAERFAAIPEIVKAHNEGLEFIRFDKWSYLRKNRILPDTNQWRYGWRPVRVGDRMWTWQYRGTGDRSGGTLMVLLESDMYPPARFARLARARVGVSELVGEELDDEILQNIARHCEKENITSLVLATGVVYSFGRFGVDDSGSVDYNTLQLSDPIAFDAFDPAHCLPVAQAETPNIPVLALPEYGTFRISHSTLTDLPMHNPGASVMQILVYWLLRSMGFYEKRLNAEAIIASQSQQSQSQILLPLSAAPSYSSSSVIMASQPRSLPAGSSSGSRGAVPTGPTAERQSQKRSRNEGDEEAPATSRTKRAKGHVVVVVVQQDIASTSTVPATLNGCETNAMNVDEATPKKNRTPRSAHAGARPGQTAVAQRARVGVAPRGLVAED